MSFRYTFNIFAMELRWSCVMRWTVTPGVTSANFCKIRRTLNNCIFRFAKNLLSYKTLYFPASSIYNVFTMPKGKEIPMKFFNRMTFSKSFDKLHHILIFEFATLPITKNMLFWEASCVSIKFFQASEGCIPDLPITVKQKQVALNFLVNKECNNKEVIEPLFQRALCILFWYSQEYAFAKSIWINTISDFDLICSKLDSCILLMFRELGKPDKSNK